MQILMKPLSFKLLLQAALYFVPFLFQENTAFAAACDQTLSPGANVASAVSSAVAGSTICLNSGDYGSVSLSNISKSSAVILQSLTGVGAKLHLTVSSSSHLTFKNLTISGVNMWGSPGMNTYISILNNVFTGQMQIVGNGSAQHNLIDGNTFDAINACANCYEGRLQIYGGGDLVVSNNHFGKAGESDGIQMGGYGTTIGPGNVFDGIIQGSYGRHVDAIQLYGEVDHQTITGNYFLNGDTYVMAPDGGNAVTFTNNVFKTGYGSYYWKVQLGSHTNGKFSHNTVAGEIGVSIDAKVGSPAGSNNVTTNNLMINSSFKIIDSAGRTACTSCTFDHNLFNVSSNAMGTNNLIGNPTFVGGATPASWAGYQLTSSSLGYRTASDGLDMGPTSFGTSPPSPTVLAAPTNLRLVIGN